MDNSKDVNDPSRLSTGSRLKFLAKDSVIYGGASALNKSFSLITFPILARNLTVAEYGIIDFFNVIATMLTIFLVFGQDSAVARFFYEYKDTDSREQVITQSLLFQLCCVGVILPITWMLSDSIVMKLHSSPQAEKLFHLILLQIPFQLFMNFSQNLLKWTFSRLRFLIVSVGSVIVRVFCLLLLLHFYHLSVELVFIINLGVSVLFGLLGMVFVRQWIVRPTGLGYLKDLIPFAIPLGIVCTLGAFVPTMERAMVSNLFGEHDLGLYAAGAKLAILISLPIQAFQMAWGPFSLAIHKEKNASATYNWVLKILTLGLCLLVLVLVTIATPLLNFLATNRFSGATLIVFPLAMGLAIQAMGWVPGTGIAISKKSILNLYSYLGFVVVSLTSIYGLANTFGLIGIAYGTMLGYCTKAILESFFGQLVWRQVEWNFGSVIIIPTITIFVGVFGHILFLVYGEYLQLLVYGFSIPIIILFGWKKLFTNQERKRLAEVFSNYFRLSRTNNNY